MASLAVVAGCPSPEPVTGCEASGAFAVSASLRNEASSLEDGQDVAVFTPPQGGVATELDVRFTGVLRDDLQSVRVDVVDDSGGLLGAEMYFGEGLPFQCEEDSVLLVRAMPVPFALDVVLEDLDGADAVVRVLATTVDGKTAEQERSVTLRIAAY